MDLQRMSDEWLFARHPQEQIIRWVTNLKYFYYKRAWGGHANDGDEFTLTLTYQGRQDLLDTLDRLGVTLNFIPKDNPKPVPGKSYTYDEHSSFKTAIQDSPEYEQPKRTTINGIKTYCWIENGSITFTLSGGQDGNYYEVSETDFENCKKLEKLITDADLTAKVSRQFENDITCISRNRYGHMFGDRKGSQEKM